MPNETLHSVVLVVLDSQNESTRNNAITRLLQMVQDRFADSLTGYLFNVRSIAKKGVYFDARDLVNKSIDAFIKSVVTGAWKIEGYKTEEDLIKGIQKYLYKTVDGLAQKEFLRHKRSRPAARFFLPDYGDGTSGSVEETWADFRNMDPVMSNLEERENLARVRAVLRTMNAKYAALIEMLMEFHGRVPKWRINLFMEEFQITTKGNYATTKSRALASLMTHLDFIKQLRSTVDRTSKRNKK